MATLVIMRGLLLGNALLKMSLQLVQENPHYSVTHQIILRTIHRKDRRMTTGKCDFIYSIMSENNNIVMIVGSNQILLPLVLPCFPPSLMETRGRAVEPSRNQELAWRLQPRPVRQHLLCNIFVTLISGRRTAIPCTGIVNPSFRAVL
jgi:hypothetical protein